MGSVSMADLTMYQEEDSSLDLNSNFKHKRTSIDAESSDRTQGGPAPNKTVFDCPTYESSGYQQHLSPLDDRPARWKCGNCGQTFVDDHHLYFHLRVHIPRELRRLCPHCPFVSAETCRLENHLKDQHLTAIRCNVCSVQVGDTRAELSSHLYTCHIVKKTKSRVHWPRFDSDQDQEEIVLEVPPIDPWTTR